MKIRSSLKDETNSLTMASTESRSMLLGEEAGSDRLALYYENQKNLIKVHFEKKKQKLKPLNTKNEQQKTLTLPKTAPARLEQKPNLLKEVSMLNLSSVRNSSIRYSAREKIIMEWAFKRFDDEVEVKKAAIEKQKTKTRFDHEFWFEDDTDTLKGAIGNKDIDLSDADIQNTNNLDFYRTNRRAVTTKTDIEINRHTKQLDVKLIDLSKERYKILGVLDYEKKKFVRHQLLKSESLPGLRCVALLNETPDYKFKKHGKVISFEKIHQQTNDFESTTKSIFPDINSSLVNDKNQVQVSKPGTTDAKLTTHSDDNKLQRANTIALVENINKLETNLPKQEKVRPKTGASDRTRKKKIEIEDELRDDFESSSLSKQIDELKPSTPTNLNNLSDESVNKLSKKSILKQPSASKINNLEQKSIIFEDQSSTSFKRIKTAKQRDFNQPKNEQPDSFNVMLSIADKHEADEVESLNSETSFNPADTLITNNLITDINDQTLAASIRIVNDFKELEEYSFELADSNTNMDSLTASFIKSRAKNVSSLSEPNTKISDDNEEIVQRSIDDSTINLKTKDHKVSFKLTNETKNNINKPLNIRNSANKKELKEKETVELVMLNNKPKVPNNNLPKKPIRTVKLEQQKLKENNLALDASNSSYQKLELYSEPSLPNLQYISPIQDNRFRDLISIVKPAFISKETKDVKNIIEKNDALKSINIDFETREKMSKVKERGSKLAIKARQILASGEYNYHV